MRQGGRATLTALRHINLNSVHAYALQLRSPGLRGQTGIFVAIAVSRINQHTSSGSIKSNGRAYLGVSMISL